MTKLTPAQARKKHQGTFDRFWSVYPRHTHINEAANTWAKLMESGVDPVRVINAARSFATRCGTDLKYVPGPHRWLDAGQYDDADLFQDESAAVTAWLKEMWRQGNVKAVENRFHISMPKEYPPDDISSPDAIRFWYRNQARAWITEVYRSKVECQQASQPTMPEQSSQSSEPSSPTQDALPI